MKKLLLSTFFALALPCFAQYQPPPPGSPFSLTGTSSSAAQIQLSDGVQPVYNYILSTGDNSSNGYSRIFFGSNVTTNAAGSRTATDNTKPYTFLQMENNWLNGVGSQRQNEINWTGSDAAGQERRAFNWYQRTDNREIGGFGFFFPIQILPSSAYYTASGTDARALDIQYDLSGDTAIIRIWNTNATTGAAGINLLGNNNNWSFFTDRNWNGGKNIGIYDNSNAGATVMQFDGSYNVTIGGTMTAKMAANTIEGNNTGSTANSTDLTRVQVNKMMIDDGVAMMHPVTLYVRNVPVLTTGGAGDLATTINLSQYGITRWRTTGTNSSTDPGIIAICESTGGSLSGVTFEARDGASGAGTQMAGATGALAGAGSYGLGQGRLVTPSTSTTLYIYQLGTNTVAGNVSVYVRVLPLN